MYLFTHKNPEIQLDREHTALVVTDIQNEFLTEGGSYYPLIEESLKEHKVFEHLEELLKCAQESGMYIIHSPHWYYPSDGQWIAQGGAIADFLGGINFVRRKDPLSLEGFVGSGADFPERLKRYLQDGHTCNCSPHKGASPQTNDVIKQLRQRRVEKVIMAGPVGNICLESHMRDIIEAGMEVAMVRNAVAGSRNEEGDAYTAAMVNYRFFANAIWTTAEAVKRMKAAAAA
jgi:nicotinamidase-related amidase